MGYHNIHGVILEIQNVWLKIPTANNSGTTSENASQFSHCY